jgi:kynurenine formamidase
MSDGSRKSINYSRVVGLSRLVHPGMPQWPGDPAVDFETVAEMHRDGYYLRRFSLGEHSGTHLNAPSSFHPDGINGDYILDTRLNFWYATLVMIH